MKKILLLLTTICVFSAGFSQQGVAINNDGSNADNSALLDIKSSTKGILIPRLTSAQKTAIVAPATGLLIYQTDGTTGFYFFNGSAWAPLSSAQGPLSGWATTGNAGTDSSLNFIGTSDSRPLIGKVNGEQAFYFSPTKAVTSIGYQAGKFNTANYNHFIGYQAGMSTTTGLNNFFEGYKAGYSNTTANYNQFTGYNAGYSNTTGITNFFEGYQAGFTNTSGNQNYFSGVQAGYSNTASQNHFVGYQAGFNNTLGNNNHFDGFAAGSYNTTGSNNFFEGYQSGYSNNQGNNNHFSGFQAGYNNTAGLNNMFIGYQSGYSNSNGFGNNFLGFKAGYSNVSGYYNTYIGFQAGYYNTGSGNVFIGYQAGIPETTGNNKLYISNNQTNSPLIYGEFDNKLLKLYATTNIYGDAMVSGKMTAWGATTLNGFTQINAATSVKGQLAITTSYSGDDFSIENSTGEERIKVGQWYHYVYDAPSPANSMYDVYNSAYGDWSTGFKIYGNGDAELFGTLTEVSDARYKKNISSLTGALNKIRQLRAVSYNWLDERKDTTEQIGFIAQEMEKVFPQLVKTSKDGHKSVAYAHVVPVLVEAVKEQQQQIDELKKEIEELKKR